MIDELAAERDTSAPTHSFSSYGKQGPRPIAVSTPRLQDNEADMAGAVPTLPREES